MLEQPALACWSTSEGLPFPLGPTLVAEEDAYNFALYSKHAESVTLLLYAESDTVNPALAHRFDYLKNKTGRVWHCRIPLVSMKGAAYYAYRVEGPKPNGRFEQHCFDGDKVLLDPYAKSVFFPPAFDRLAATRPGSNAGQAPLGVLTGDNECFDWLGDRPCRHEADTVIYEMHVGEFTKNPNSGVKDERRGTFAGVVDKIPYLKDLGVTVVELMPVFQYDPGDDNYWGYMPLNFFSPHHGYLSDRSVKAQHNEVREMIKALHQADIEVVIDAVYNHTAGNSNPYNQDNSAAWSDWSRLDANPDIFRFFKLMIACRKAHPSLARSRFWREDVRWYGVGRDADLTYDSRSLAFALRGGSQSDVDLCVMINAHWEELVFQIQEGDINAWRRVVDTSLESPLDFLENANEILLRSLHYRVPCRAVVVLVRATEGAEIRG